MKQDKFWRLYLVIVLQNYFVMLQSARRKEAKQRTQEIGVQTHHDNPYEDSNGAQLLTPAWNKNFPLFTVHFPNS